MGAETKVYVKVIKEVEEWITVDAVTLSQAEQEAYAEDEVIRVVAAQYDPPDGD